jgi:hypothetical protein
MTATPESDRETAVVPYVTNGTYRGGAVWAQKKAAAAGPNGKFNEERRAKYLRERADGTPHSTACRRAGVAPVTVERYSAAVGLAWTGAVRAAVEESLDPIRAVRRGAALAGEPWAVRAEIGDGRAARAPAEGGGNTVNIGTVVLGGADGVSGALGEVLERLRERQAALGDNANEPGP